MPVVVLLFLSLILGFTAYIMWIGWVDPTSPFRNKTKTFLAALILTVAFSGLVWWQVVAGSMAWVTEREFVVPITKIAKPDGTYSQYIFYVDKLGHDVILNCSKETGLVIPEGFAIKVREFKDGNYFGIDYGGISDSPQYSVVKSK